MLVGLMREGNFWAWWVNWKIWEIDLELNVKMGMKVRV